MRHFYLVLCLALPRVAFGQDEAPHGCPEPSKYIQLSAGLGRSSLRDYATSPLFYEARGMRFFTLARFNAAPLKEAATTLSYATGNYVLDYNDQTTASKVQSVSAAHHRLYRIDCMNNDKWNLKAGGSFTLTGNLRNNQNLMNNAIGIEFISNLSASAKISRDVSRTQTREKKLLFFRYTARPVTRSLSFRLDAGLLNGAFRNGYVYLGQSAIRNKSNVFDGYEFHIGGKRFSSILEYTIWRPNKNAYSFAYVWDAYQTGKTFERFEMAQHSIRCSLFFNTNNR